MIVCPFNPEAILQDTLEAFYCSGCRDDCRLLKALGILGDYVFKPDADSTCLFSEEDIEK